MNRVSRKLQRATQRAHYAATHAVGRLTGRNYHEDYIRVYPDGLEFTRRGHQRQASEDQRRNYLNHVKFYEFASQFAADAVVIDAGCGSGYGCDVLARSGATEVLGADVSRKAIEFAIQRYPAVSFSVQEITKMNLYADDLADLTICSEVLEHIKEYGKEDLALAELHRVTKPGGVVVVGTPNSELLGDHGFTYQEMEALFSEEFKQFVIFENALVPFEPSWLAEWEGRLRSGKVGTVVSENVAAGEIAFTGGKAPRVKKGARPGKTRLGSISIDTKLLHNTHSWVVVAIA